MEKYFKFLKIYKNNKNTLIINENIIEKIFEIKNIKYFLIADIDSNPILYLIKNNDVWSAIFIYKVFKKTYYDEYQYQNQKVNSLN